MLGGGAPRQAGTVATLATTYHLCPQALAPSGCWPQEAGPGWDSELDSGCSHLAGPWPSFLPAKVWTWWWGLSQHWGCCCCCW